MSQEAKYSYIEWLPENRLILATQQSLLKETYLTGLFGKNIYAYSRDDSANFMLPSLSIDSGEIFSYDNLDRIEGEIVINAYFSTDLIRNKTTEVIQTTMATLRQRIQNYNFFESVILNMVEYEKYMKNNFIEQKFFIDSIKQYQWLSRYGIQLKYKPANSLTLQGKSCYKATMTFKYWLMQQNYYQFLEIIGINGQIDPNKIVYNLWEEFYPHIVDLSNE